MQYQGKIYRPWMEANSVLFQTTLGCAHNRCTFCSMFDDKRFTVRDIQDVFDDIVQARRTYPSVKSVFLTDGNALAMKTDHLLSILDRVSQTFPECERISLYAGFNDFRRKSSAELIALRKAGLSKAYVGLESGDPVTLSRIKKGLTPTQAQEGMAKAKAAGIEILASVIFGLGSAERSAEHIAETVKLLNALQPEEIAPRARTIQPGTKLERQVESGEFVQVTRRRMLEEEKLLLENLDFKTFYWGDHANSIVPARGPLPQSKATFLDRIDDALAQCPENSSDVHLAQPW